MINYWATNVTIAFAKFKIRRLSSRALYRSSFFCQNFNISKVNFLKNYSSVLYVGIMQIEISIHFSRSKSSNFNSMIDNINSNLLRASNANLNLSKIDNSIESKITYKKTIFSMRKNKRKRKIYKSIVSLLLEQSRSHFFEI